MPKQFRIDLTCPSCLHQWSLAGDYKQKVGQAQCPQCHTTFIPSQYPNLGTIMSHGTISVENQAQVGVWMTLDAATEIQEICTAWQALLEWLNIHQIQLTDLQAIRSFQRVESAIASLEINARLEEEYAFEDLNTHLKRLASNIKDAFHLVINNWEPYQTILTTSNEVQSWFA